MDRRTRAQTKRLLIATGSAWTVLIGALMFLVLPTGDVQTMNSPQVQDRLRDECAGSFQQRYQCKESIIVAVGRDTFANLALRLALVVAGPLAGAVFYHTRCRPDPIHRLPLAEDEAGETLPVPHSAVADDEWKRRAQRHIAQARPPAPVDGDEQ